MHLANGDSFDAPGPPALPAVVSIWQFRCQEESAFLELKARPKGSLQPSGRGQK